MKCKIDDACFLFTINLMKTTSESFYNNFMKIMYASLFELHHRYNTLIDIVKKKDIELEEYKAQGKEILRSKFITYLVKLFKIFVNHKLCIYTQLQRV